MNARLAIFIAIIAMCGTIYFYAANQKTEKDPSLHAALENKIAQLKIENKKITEEKINLEKKFIQSATNQHTQLSSISSASASSINSSLIVNDATSSLLAKKADDFQKWLIESSKQPGFNLGNEMQKRFDSEQIDFNWAQQQEGKFLDIFTNDKELSGTALKQATCRSTQCKISVSISNLENANEILMTISRALQGDTKNVMVIASPNIENGETVLYVSRDESSFEFK